MAWMRHTVAVLLSSLALIGCGETASSSSTDDDTAGDGGIVSDCTTVTVTADADAGVNWVTIPAAGVSFTMGCTTGDDYCLSTESTAHTVTFTSSFQITQTEITWEQFLAAYANDSTLSVPYYDSTSTSTKGVLYGDNYPVGDVSYAAAAQYCADIGGRLPSEAEWEYASRGGTTDYIFGYTDDVDLLTDYAWDSVASRGRTHPVSKLAPNGYCLYDMLGNMNEWVADCWHAAYDTSGDGGMPTDGTAWSTNCSTNPSSAYVLRGGSYASDEPDPDLVSASSLLRVSARTPESSSGDYYSSAEGFRCVKDVE